MSVHMYPFWLKLVWLKVCISPASKHSFSMFSTTGSSRCSRKSAEVRMKNRSIEALSFQFNSDQMAALLYTH